MPVNRPYGSEFDARLAFWLLAGFFVVLWFAGGASRADVAGQAVARFFAWIVLIVLVLSSHRINWRPVWPVALLFALSVLTVLLQLLPLPPAAWSALPGHEILLRGAEVSRQPQPWRPMSISPSATVNALGSLVVPGAVLVLGANLSPSQHWRILALILAAIFAGCILGLLQFSGARFSNPLINYVAGSTSGNFANRNHFALFVALGCLMAPVWGLQVEGRVRWKPITAIALVVFFVLVILAIGSRAGLVLTLIAMVLGFLIVRTRVMREIRALPRPIAIGIVASVPIAVVTAVVASISLNRAVAVDRVLDLEASSDLRSQALPHVVDATIRYFPFGSGFGTFDPAYRMVEPDELLRLVYFNHAHNDWLETVLTGGLPGALLLIAALTWYARATFRALRREREGASLALVGSAGLLLFMIASLVDYPARTPMGMAIVMVLAVWLQMTTRPSSAHRPG